MSSFQIDGIVSGLRTGDIVSQLMSLERRPLQALETQKAQEEARKQAWASIKSKFAALQSAIQKLTLRSTVNARSATTDTPSTTPAFVSVAASADAAIGSFKVAVHRLATQTVARNGSHLGAAVSQTALLKDAGFTTAVDTSQVDGQDRYFTVNGVRITADANDKLFDAADPANSMAHKIQSALGVGWSVTVENDASGRANLLRITAPDGVTPIHLGAGDDTSNFLKAANLIGANSAVIGSNNTVTSTLPMAGVATGEKVSSAAARFAGGAVVSTAGQFKVNGVAIDYTLDDTVNTIISRINASSAGVRASYEAATDKILLTNVATGGQAVSVEKVVGAGAITQSNLSADPLTASGTYTGATNVRYSVKVVEVAAGDDATKVGPTKVEISADGGAPVTVVVDAAGNVTDPSLNGLTLKLGVTGTATALGDTYSFTAYAETGGTTGRTGFVDVAQLSTSQLAQTYGQNASYTINPDLPGATAQSSASNTISGAVPGVTLNLLRSQDTTGDGIADGPPITVTVAQDAATTKSSLQSLVTTFNAVLDEIAKQTKYDLSRKQGSPLTGESTVQGLERTLRSLANGRALGLTGKYQSLADIGVSTGKVGSEVGTTNRLQLDEAKLTAALTDNSQAVEAVVAGFLNSASALTSVSGGLATKFAALTGRPTTTYESGSFHVKITDVSSPTSPKADVWFVSSETGQATKATSVTFAEGSANTTAVPGVTLTLNSGAGATLAVGHEMTFAVNVSQRGLMPLLKSRLDTMLGASGIFATRDESATEAARKLDRRISDMVSRLAEKEKALTRKFAALEAAMARAQSQSGSLSAALQRMNGGQ